MSLSSALPSRMRSHSLSQISPTCAHTPAAVHPPHASNKRESVASHCFETRETCAAYSIAKLAASAGGRNRGDTFFEMRQQRHAPTGTAQGRRTLKTRGSASDTPTSDTSHRSGRRTLPATLNAPLGVSMQQQQQQQQQPTRTLHSVVPPSATMTNKQRHTHAAPVAHSLISRRVAILC